jgi:hypothetical protein
MAETANPVEDGMVTFPDARIEAVTHVWQAQVGVLMADPKWAQGGVLQRDYGSTWPGAACRSQ